MKSNLPGNGPQGGLFDFQINGFGGVDFQSDQLTPADVRKAVAALWAHHTSRIFVALITDETDRLCRRLEKWERMRAADRAIAGTIVGYHLEGPWLNPETGFCGAHPPGPMHAPSEPEFERLQAAAGGCIRLVTLAPEWPGSGEFISALTTSGVQVSLGHTNASEAQIDLAISAGARFCTHLGNAVPMVLPRHDNVVQRLLARDELTACFIPDGIHLPRFVLRNFFRAKPAGRVLFTTDAMAGAGAPAGRYTLGESVVNVGTDRIARNPRGGGFAGSTLTPDDGVTRVADYLGLTPELARRMWSEVPAAAFKLDP